MMVFLYLCPLIAGRSVICQQQVEEDVRRQLKSFLYEHKMVFHGMARRLLRDHLSKSRPYPMKYHAFWFLEGEFDCEVLIQSGPLIPLDKIPPKQTPSVEMPAFNW